MASADSPPLPSVTRWPIVALTVGAGMVCAFQVGKAPAALPALREDLGIGLVTAGWVISVFNLIGILLGMPAGAIADRIGHRRIILTGLWLVGAASLVGAAAPGAAFLLATRFLEGLGFILSVVAAPGLIVRAAQPRDIKLAFGLWGAYMPAGAAFITLATPLLLAPFGWRGLWLVNGAVAIAFALLLARATQAMSTHERRATAGDAWRSMIRTATSPGPIVLALVFGAYALQYISVLGFLPTVLIEQEGMPRPLATTLTAIAIAVNVIGNLVAGVLLHRGAPRWALVLIANIAMGLSALGIYDGDLPVWLRYGLCIALSMIGGILPASIHGASPAHAPSPALLATTNGLIAQGSNLGQTIGPPAVAALAAAHGSWALSPLVLCTAAAIGIMLAVALGALERRRDTRS